MLEEEHKERRRRRMMLDEGEGMVGDNADISLRWMSQSV
jgi:hypothetical protein